MHSLPITLRATLRIVSGDPPCPMPVMPASVSSQHHHVALRKSLRTVGLVIQRIKKQRIFVTRLTASFAADAFMAQEGSATAAATPSVNALRFIFILVLISYLVSIRRAETQFGALMTVKQLMADSFEAIYHPQGKRGEMASELQKPETSQQQFPRGSSCPSRGRSIQLSQLERNH